MRSTKLLVTFGVQAIILIVLLSTVGVVDHNKTQVLAQHSSPFPATDALTSGNSASNMTTQEFLQQGRALQIITSIVPDYGISTPFFSASIPFVAHGVTLWCCSTNLSGEPFIVGYEVSAKLGQPATVNNITTTANPNTVTGNSLG